MVYHSHEESSAPPQLGRVWNHVASDNAETNSILNMFAQKEKEAASSLVTSTVSTNTDTVNTVTSSFETAKAKQPNLYNTQTQSKQPTLTTKTKLKPKLNPMNNNPASTFLDSPVGKMFAPLPQHQQQRQQHVSAPMTMAAPLTMMNTATTTTTVGVPSHTRTPTFHAPTYHAPPATAMGLGHHNMSMSANHNKGRLHSRARSEMPASGKGKNYFDLAADGFEQPVSSSFSPVKNDIIASMLNEPLHSSKKHGHGHGHKKSHSRGRSMDFASMNMNLSTAFHRQAAAVTSQAQAQPPADDVSVMACCEGMTMAGHQPPRPPPSLPPSLNALHAPYAVNSITTAQQLRMGSPHRASSPMLASLLDLPNPKPVTGTSRTNNGSNLFSPPRRYSNKNAALAISQLSAMAAGVGGACAAASMTATSRAAHAHVHNSSRCHSRSKSAISQTMYATAGGHPLLASKSHPLPTPVGGASPPRIPNKPMSMNNSHKDNKDKDVNSNSKEKPAKTKKAPHRRHKTMDSNSASLYHSLSGSSGGSILGELSVPQETNAISSLSNQKKDAKKEQHQSSVKQHKDKESTKCKENNNSEDSAPKTPTFSSHKKMFKTPTRDSNKLPKTPLTAMKTSLPKTPGTAKKTSFATSANGGMPLTPGSTFKPKHQSASKASRKKGSFGKQQFKEMFPSLTKKKSGEEERDDKENAGADAGDEAVIMGPFGFMESALPELPPILASTAQKSATMSMLQPQGMIVMRSSEIDPSPHQVEMPKKKSVHSYAKLCDLAEHWREMDQNFDFASLKGIHKEEITGMCSKTSIRDTRASGPAGSKLSLQTVTFTEDHRSILEFYAATGQDFVLEEFFSVEGIFSTEAAIFSSQSLRQFVVYFRGSDELQAKPFKNALPGFTQGKFFSLHFYRM
jgi:hypothetical protein